MSYTIQQPSVAGRIGKGFAKGLSEQLPKEIQNERLASAYENLGNDTKLTPPQQMASLLRSGISPEQLPQHFSMVREAQQRKSFQDKYGKPEPTKNPIPPPEEIKASPTTPNAAEVEGQPEKKTLLASPAEIKKFKQSILQRPDAQAINQMASEMLEMGLAQSVPEAQKLASQQLQQDLEAQNTKLNNFRTGLENRITNDLQKAGFDKFKDVPGELQTALVDQGEYLVGKGMTPEAANQEIANIVKDLGKTATQTKTMGAISNLMKPSSEKVRELKDQKKQYEKYGFGEVFDDVATSALGTTPMQTAAVLDPLHNKEIDKILSKQKKPVSFGFGGVGTEYKIKDTEMDDLIKSINPKDNLLSVAEKLRSADIDVNQFYTRLSQLEDEGQIALTPQQIRQRNKPASNSVLGDIMFKLFK